MKYIRTATILVLLTFCLLPVEAQNTNAIALGPYVQNVTTESATICWSTVSGVSTLTMPDGEVVEYKEYEQHEMRLARLEPNTTYPYDVLGIGAPQGMGSFTTFPEQVKPFRFVALGDTRSRHDIHTKIVEMVMAKQPMFVVNTGDLVSDGDSIHDWQHFFSINNELMRNTPYFPVLGNHEHDSRFYFNFFDLPGNERYYNLSIGDVLFLFLDTEGAQVEKPEYVSEDNEEDFWRDASLEYMQNQKKWVEHQLQLHREAGFVFVFFHQPLYSIKKTRVEDTKLRKKFWGDIFERHGVQVILNGHDHHYHHAFHGGTHYVTTAGGGAGLYEPDTPQPETVLFKKIEHFVTVDVGIESSKLTATDINGDIIEEIVVQRRNTK